VRIFYASTHSTNSRMPSSRLWYINLYLPLVDLGHRVISLEYDLVPHYLHADPSDPLNAGFIERNRPRLERALLDQIKSAHRAQPIDLFFSYFYGTFCSPEVIREIRSLGITTINWYCNGSYQFDLVRNIAPAYDYCLVPEKFRLEDYRSIGAHPIYFQEAANPRYYKPYALPQQYDVVFIGQRYGERPEYIRHVVDEGIDVRVWGWGWVAEPARATGKSVIGRLSKLKRLATIGGWKSIARRLSSSSKPERSPQRAPTQTHLPESIVGPPLSDEEMVKMYSRARISLGFSSCAGVGVNGERILQVRLRDFEAPMSRAFYMVEYMPELEEFFDIGKEIVCYDNKLDLTDKIKYYLKHPGEREQIREAGYRRALSEHTWHRRFSGLFRQLGLS
jgi:spore maturation protein CgeB